MFKYLMRYILSDKIKRILYIQIISDLINFKLIKRI